MNRLWEKYYTEFHATLNAESIKKLTLRKVGERNNHLVFEGGGLTARYETWFRGKS